MQLLIILAAVLTSSLVAATAQNASWQCVSQQEFNILKKQLATSQQEFDTLKEQLARSRQETAAVKREVDSWQNSTILILKQYLIENPRDVKTELQQIKDELTEIKQEIREDIATRNTSLQGDVRTALQQIKDELTQIKQEMREEHIITRNTSLQESTALQQQLQLYIQSLEQNRTRQEMAMLLSQNTIQRFPNGTFQNPAPSCKNIEQGSPSGYYWVQRSAGGYAHQLYCNMTRRCNSTGGWMRVADLDMTNPTHRCPQGFRTITSPKRMCGKSGPGCVSVTFNTYRVQYQKVCGRVIGYQYYSPDAFSSYYANRGRTIDDQYVDGVSITHGSSPRKHVWTFAAANDESRSNRYACPCTRNASQFQGVVPPFIGQDYFCETGSRYSRQDRTYTHDPLWDGRGCGATSTCCSFNSPPWFCKQLPQSTTDDIELRLCGDEALTNEDTPLEVIELYIQ